MRVLLPTLLALVACDTGVLQLEDDALDTESDIDPVDDDTDPGTDDETDVRDSDPGSEDTDPGNDDSDSPEGPDPLGVGALAWDGKVRWTFSQWWGGTCVYTVTESGEQMATSDAGYAAVAGQCPSCSRLFAVRLVPTGQPCLEEVPDTEWRGLEVRPTGALIVRLIRKDPTTGAFSIRETLPNVALSGDTFTIRYSTFAPVYANTVVAGSVKLTPLP